MTANARRPRPPRSPPPFTPSNAMKRILSSLLAVVALGSVLRADPTPDQPVPDQLDLKTAIRFAVENNFQIREARERIRQQTGVLIQVRAGDLPTLVASGDYQINQKKISQVTPPSNDFWQVSLVATENVYAGGGVEAGIRNASLGKDAAVLDLKSVINAALLDVRTKFYTVLLDREKVSVQEQNIKLLESQLKDASNRFEAGSASAFEKLQAQVSLANGQVPLISARNDLRIAIDQLRQSLGFTTTSREATRKVPEFIGNLDNEPASFEIQSALDSARANRPEIQRYQKLVDAGVKGVTVARSSYYPTVDLTAGWQAEKNPYPQLIHGSSVNGFSAAVKGSWSIFDGGNTRGKVVQAKSLLEQARLTLGEQTLAIDVEVRQAYSSWQEAVELTDATKQTVGQAEESLRLATARYNAGSATHLDVLQAETDLTLARTNLVQANFSYAVAVATLREAMGVTDVLFAE